MTSFRDAARRVLEARLPADDPKWGPWIEGTLDELDTLPGVVLDHREAQTRTPAEKLAKIAALPIVRIPRHGRAQMAMGDRLMFDAEEVLAILAEPGPAVQHEFVGWSGNPAFCSICGVPHSRHAEPGPAVPAHDIDRDALAWAISDVLMRVYDNGTSPNARGEAEEVVKVVLPFVRPAEGVILSPDEVALARSWYTRLPIGVSPDDVALAARLEASS